MGVVQDEGHRPGQPGAGVEGVELGVQDGRAGLEGLAEPLLLVGHDVAQEPVVLDQRRVGLAHDLDGGVDQAGGDQVVDVEQVGVAHGAPDHAADHVAPTLVGREDAVADQEAHGPGVLGQDAQRHVLGLGSAQPTPGDRLGGLDERDHHVDLPHRVLALQHAQDALQPRARVDVLAGQLGVHAVAIAVVLHEHQVPDLQEPGLAAVPRTAALAVALAQVDEDLRVGPARTRWPTRAGPTSCPPGAGCGPAPPRPSRSRAARPRRPRCGP